jgi:PHD/YefM family antitoxin component YafN of YafNO toxin-antitoxin module
MDAYPIDVVGDRLTEIFADNNPVRITRPQAEAWVLMPASRYVVLASGCHVAEHLIEGDRQRREPLPAWGGAWPPPRS